MQAESQVLAPIQRADVVVGPRELEARIAEQDAMRTVLINYMQTKMIEKHHYYWLKESDKKADPNSPVRKKPSLTKEGAHNIIGLCRMVATPAEEQIIMHDDGNMTVRCPVLIKDRNGDIVAYGSGMASTRESRYNSGFKWMTRKQIEELELVPVDQLDSFLETLESKQFKSKYKEGEFYSKYKLESTSNPADHYNTVLKVGYKRGLTDAANAIPLVSELFSQGFEPEEIETRKHMAVTDSDGVSYEGNGGEEQPVKRGRRSKPSSRQSGQQGEEEAGAAMVDAVGRLLDNYTVAEGEAVFTLTKKPDTGLIVCSCERPAPCRHFFAVRAYVDRQRANSARAAELREQQQEPGEASDEAVEVVSITEAEEAEIGSPFDDNDN